MTSIPDALYWELRARHADVELARAHLREKLAAMRQTAVRIKEATGLDVTQGNYTLEDAQHAVMAAQGDGD